MAGLRRSGASHAGSRFAEPTPALWEKVRGRRSSGTQNDQRAEEVLRVLRALHAKTPNTSHEAKVISARVGEAFEQVRSNPDSLRKAVKRALDALIADGKAEADSEGGFRIVTPATYTVESNDIIH